MTNEEKKATHLETIKNHRKYVREMCNLMGIPKAGKLHDISKFSKEEMSIYTWADGKRSPHDNARDELGYSPSWVHHKAKNQHHWEYWTDFNSATANPDGSFTIICRCVKMPYDKVVEMFCDFVGAGKAYSKDSWTVHTPWDYWKAKCENQRAMHPTSYYLIKKLLWNLDQAKSLDDFVNWYKKNQKYLKDSYEDDFKTEKMLDM